MIFWIIIFLIILACLGYWGYYNKKYPAKKGYNYPRFKASYYDLAQFPGPKAGELFPSFSLQDHEGKTIEIEKMRGKWCVIETGSVSCPMYVLNIEKMNTLQEKYPDIHFLLLYVREAHPGEKLHPFDSLQQKHVHITKLKKWYPERRPIVLDNVEGEIHHAIGSHPNCIYIVNPEGRILFRSDWNHPEVVEEILNKRDSEELIHRDHYEPKKPSPFLAIRVLGRAGILAVIDFAFALPALMASHRKTRDKTNLD